MQTRYLIAAALVLPVLGAGAALAQDAVSPDARWAQVSACAAERSAESRHSCVDAVLRAAGALDRETEEAVNRENFGRTERSAPVAARAPAPAPAQAPMAAPPALASAAQPARVAPPPPARIEAPEPVNGITTQVASARMGNDRRLLVTTAEGAVWHQVDSDNIRRLPRAGESFEVRSGALGSFRCTFNATTTFRCERRD